MIYPPARATNEPCNLLCFIYLNSFFLSPYIYRISNIVSDTPQQPLLSSFLFSFSVHGFEFSLLPVSVASTWLRASYCILGDLCGISQINPLGQCSHTPREDIVHDLQLRFHQNLKDITFCLIILLNYGNLVYISKLSAQKLKLKNIYYITKVNTNHLALTCVQT